MPWRLVRLEHGPTGAFPAGSAIRAYLLRIPLQPNGHIDAQVHAEEPLRATMRRFWPSEPDRSGYVVRKRSRWHLVTLRRDLQDRDIGWFEDCALALGKTVEIVESGNGVVPYQVAAIRRD